MARPLLVIALLLGSVVAATAAWFEDVTATAGIPALRHGEGVNAVDIDGDDWPDLYLPSVREGGHLLLNQKDGTFRDVTAARGTGAGGGVGAAIGDLNGDGRPDIYVARGADPYVAPNLVYLQQSDGTFRDAAASAGVGGKSSGLTVILADFDSNGTLDAFLPGWGGDTLYRNDGHARLSDVSAGSGLIQGGRGWAAVTADFDGDGRLDLFVAHGSPTAPHANRLYRNRGDGTFVDVTATAGLAASPWSLGAVAADFDGDGDFDLYIAGYNGAGKLYRNEGGWRFTDVTATCGITAAKGVGAVAGMIDGDLLPDLVIGGFAGPVELYRNLGGMTFTRVGTDAGLAPYRRNEGLTLVDYDGDGDLDLYVSNVDGNNRLYRNRLDPAPALKLRFPEGGRPLVGSIARLRRSDRLLATAQLDGAVGMGQGPQEIVFRLPDAGPYDLTVTLPDGRTLAYRNLTPGTLRLP